MNLINLSCAVPAMILALVASASVVEAQSQKYPPLSEYMMPQAAEISLARSAAPERITSRATVKVLSSSGYTVAVSGDNGFTCMVLRGWAAPTLPPVPRSCPAARRLARAWRSCWRSHWRQRRADSNSGWRSENDRNSGVAGL